MRLTAVLQARQASFKYWQRFVDSRMQEGAIRQKWNPIVGWQEKKREHWHYDENRPWTMNALEKQQQLENLYRGDDEGLKKAKRNVVNPIKNWNMFREDRVRYVFVLYFIIHLRITNDICAMIFIILILYHQLLCKEWVSFEHIFKRKNKYIEHI